MHYPRSFSLELDNSTPSGRCRFLIVLLHHAVTLQMLPHRTFDGSSAVPMNHKKNTVLRAGIERPL